MHSRKPPFHRIALCCSILLVTVCLAEVREWTDNNGKTVRGELVEIGDETVKLRSANTGDVHDVPISNLSQEDQVYILTQIPKKARDDQDFGPVMEQLTGVEFNPVVLIIIAILNLPLYFFWGKFMFSDWAGFMDAIKFWLTPDSWSFWRGEAMDDWFAEMKLFFWIAGSVAAVFGEYYLVQKYIL
ncbi:MAG: hypothetical protein HN742_38350 [Lentisphaerae bacterium]|jgi:hypothetical protein|nr:hypothetical protein [Lentisphaerota bacterium]MBT5609300.1 hypothetical protein [Lentisphaerota bacterium]MBT7059406.1 hypothetical protein [Lentisphaerota bacterium]MBT7847790.1 hypothetical protein [Lentisphaerota bacterium]